MTKTTFKNLRLGDQVVLNKPLRVYTYRSYAPAGSIGRVGAVHVPPVRGHLGYFACVDIAYPISLHDAQGRPAPLPADWKIPTHFRVAARPEDLTLSNQNLSVQNELITTPRKT